MPTVHIDIVDRVRWTETDGTITSIMRGALVTGLPDGGGEANVQAALNESGVPQPGVEHDEIPGLFCKRRSPTPVARDPTSIMVLCEYLLPTALDNTPPDGDLFVASGSSSLLMVQSDVDRDGNQVVLSWNDRQQTGQFQVGVPVQSLRLGHTVHVAEPELWQKLWVGKVNSQAFRTRGAGQWLCVGADFDLTERETTPLGYSFTYEFVGNDEGHDPKVVYIDPTTRKPPPGIVDDVGRKEVPWYFDVDFNLIGNQT